MVNNVDVGDRTPSRTGSRTRSSARPTIPVRWVEMRAVRSPVRASTHVVECGPGKVLAGSSKRIADGAQGVGLADRAALEQAIAALKEA